MENKYIVVLFFLMFIYSGINKIIKYPMKISGLNTKTGGLLPNFLLHIGMVSVIILEIIGSILVILYFWDVGISKQIIQVIMYIFLLFLIVVTVLYHPPTDKIIPFLSNVTTFSGLYLIKNIL